MQNVVFIVFVKNKRRRTITSSAGVDVNMWSVALEHVRSQKQVEYTQIYSDIGQKKDIMKIRESCLMFLRLYFNPFLLPASAYASMLKLKKYLIILFLFALILLPHCTRCSCIQQVSPKHNELAKQTNIFSS